MNWCLLTMFSFMGSSNALILKTQKLNVFDRRFMKFILSIQGIAIYSLIKKEKKILYGTHIIYILTLVLGSVYAKNKYIIYLILTIMGCAKIAVYCIGDCPYHSDSDRLIYGAGGENNTIFTDNLLYTFCVLIIGYRFRKNIFNNAAIETKNLHSTLENKNI